MNSSFYSVMLVGTKEYSKQIQNIFIFLALKTILLNMYVCVCACVCVCARARVRVRARECVCDTYMFYKIRQTLRVCLFLDSFKTFYESFNFWM